MGRDRWWGLVREEWLSPKDGRPITWEHHADNIESARSFHGRINGQYHPCTHVYYGDDDKEPGFETVVWRMKPGIKPDKNVPASMQVGRVSVMSLGRVSAWS
ncbi:hypothetical protein [Vulcaniibacterium tengchongense]|uniref:hypothetical protein n=1 Tax=Vulcaniibacterium tengchongense TaxID=1273429 RepID=UPI000F4F3F6E|nr:hypothetical protein [Vulcaniibacterium tengchongense]